MSSATNLMSSLEIGKVYRREALMPYTKAVDRDLKSLLEGGTLKKVGPGLYYYPKTSRFGLLPPKDYDLVNAFLKGDPFLIFSWNDYNALRIGLTQLYNKVIVYNRKRHEEIRLSGTIFSFQRPTTGFPVTVSKEFLLVDLLNNISKVGEDPEEIKIHIKNRLSSFDLDELKKLSQLYGRMSTRKFLENNWD
jgi:hypothetical protein